MSYCRSLLLLLRTVHLFLSASQLQVFLVHIRDPRTLHFFVYVFSRLSSVCPSTLVLSSLRSPPWNLRSLPRLPRPDLGEARPLENKSVLLRKLQTRSLLRQRDHTAFLKQVNGVRHQITT
ncbi:hypothetical protein JB92DRAFT_2877903 [Gautieria morchelliformis]|nr:hypothetical protein JB92DRAFT_2877903 [Gautieria morchelliformis]